MGVKLIATADAVGTQMSVNSESFPIAPSTNYVLEDRGVWAIEGDLPANFLIEIDGYDSVAEQWVFLNYLVTPDSFIGFSTPADVAEARFTFGVGPMVAEGDEVLFAVPRVSPSQAPLGSVVVLTEQNPSVGQWRRLTPEDIGAGVGGGGLALVAAGAFGPSTTPHFDDVFTSARRHRVTVIGKSTAANYLRIRFRNAGADNSAGASYVGSALGFAYAEDKGLLGGARTDFFACTFDVIDATAAAPTTLLGAAGLGGGGAAAASAVTVVRHTVSSAFAGFTLYDDSTGTLDGEYWVEAYPELP
jgi:hypothetical protein